MQRGVKTENLNIKLVKGTAKEPKRNRDTNFNEPTPTGDAVKPAFVKRVALASQIWDEYFEMGLGTRVLTSWDSKTFGTFCLMSAEIEAQAMSAKPGEALVPNSAFLAQYRMYAELFGLVPAGRTRVKEKPPMGIRRHDEKQNESAAEVQARKEGQSQDAQADDFFD